MKKIVIFIIVLLQCLCLVACGSVSSFEKEESPTQDEKEAISESSIEPEPALETIAPATVVNSPVPEPLNNDSFIETVRSNIRRSLGPRDKINDITIENKELRISISLERNDVILSRFASVTEHILTIEDGYDLWDTITIDFGSLGHITKTKDDIDISENVPRFIVDASDIAK